MWNIVCQECNTSAPEPGPTRTKTLTEETGKCAAACHRASRIKADPVTKQERRCKNERKQAMGVRGRQENTSPLLSTVCYCCYCCDSWRCKLVTKNRASERSCVVSYWIIDFLLSSAKCNWFSSLAVVVFVVAAAAGGGLAIGTPHRWRRRVFWTPKLPPEKNKGKTAATVATYSC